MQPQLQHVEGVPGPALNDRWVGFAREMPMLP